MSQEDRVGLKMELQLRSGSIEYDRRRWLLQAGMGLGGIAYAHLMQESVANVSRASIAEGLEGIPTRGTLNPTHHRPTAKRVIYLFMAGGPSQLETYDYKPLLNEKQGEPLPDSVRAGQRLTGMSGNQAVLQIGRAHV